MPNLTELAARCEAAEASEQRLYSNLAWAEIGFARWGIHTSGWPEDARLMAARMDKMLDAEAYESAALMLVLGLVREGWNWALFDIIGKPESVRIWRDAIDLIVSATTPALALTAASLRALASKEQSDEG